jgi:GH15 family glucan-1,4-alpha-glucosidase
MPSRIDDYAFLSDCHSAALVDLNGSIDWWCVPRFDSPSVFGRLLGPDAGHWSLQPDESFVVERSYIAGTLVLRTTFRTASGEVVVTDALAFAAGARGHAIGADSPHVLLRRVQAIRGEVAMTTRLAPRMDYGLTVPLLEEHGAGAVALGGPVRLALTASVGVALDGGDVVSRFTARAGQPVELRLAYTPASANPTDDGGATIDDTVDGWRSWGDQHGYEGRHRDAVRRSALVLQGLTYQPTGAVVAAATTSLPEVMGADLNFDYRFVWLRDLSLTIRALWVAACPDEAARFFAWIARAAGQLGDDQRVQIMYGVEGERELGERELDHLPGFRDSRPVRVGNAAWDQEQLDVLGEVLDAAHQLRDQLGELDEHTRALLVALADRAAATWREPDAGMWEARDARRHYTSSKVLCWVALDRAVALAPRLAAGSAVERWSREREAIHAAVVEEAWSERIGAYAGALGSDELDASVLLLPIVGFLPADDARMRATIETVERSLGDTGLVRRWADDPSGFLICTYWLVECLALAGEPERAERWFARAGAFANDVGLLAEEADPERDELLGNFPQAFSHIGLINAAWRLTEEGTARPVREP